MAPSSPSPVARVVPLHPPSSLLERLRAGEAAARAALFDRHVATVERAVHAVLGSDPDAEDLVQDAFVAAHSQTLRKTQTVREDSPNGI